VIADRGLRIAGWKSVALGELVEPAQTWNPVRSPSDEAFDYIDLSAVDQDAKLITGAREVSCGEAPSRARQLVARGDVLVSTVRPNLNGVARVPDQLDGATASTGFCVLRARESKFDGGYLFYWVKSPTFVADMVNKATGASYPAVSDRIIFDSRIPLPPLAEQRRIAEMLDRAEALRAKRRAALAQLDFLTQSLFLDLFGDPIANPKRWPDPSLGGLLTFQQYGPRFFNESYSVDGIRIVRITDLDEAGFLDFSAMPRLTVSDEDRKKYSLRPGDLIFARTGATVGKVALMQPNDPPCIAGAYFITMRFEKTLDPLYARAVLTAPSVRAIVARQSRQAAQQNFSGPSLRRLPMPLPPIELQREFAHRVTAVEKLKTAQRASLAELDALFATLRHRAFRGEL
jgi:type I restriction enzyme S subunit